jgi:general secretion pathway protein J
MVKKMIDTTPCCPDREDNSALIFKSRGFTLIEVLLAISMFAVIVVSLFSSYTGSLRIMKITEPQADLYRKARVTMSRITDDLESAYYVAGQESSEDDDAPPQFLGINEMIDSRDADTLRFISKAHISFDGDESLVGKAVLSYYVKEGDDGLILFRADTPYYAEQPEENSGGLILCDGLEGINFTYFDSEGEEYEEWDLSDEMRGGKLPSMVAVQIWMAGESEGAPLLTFSTAVALPISAQ